MSEDREYQAAEVDRRVSNVVRIGTVNAVDLPNAQARVQLDEAWITDYLPWAEIAGDAVKTWAPPSVGDQVVVLSPSGDPGCGLILRGIFSAAQPAPSNVATLTILGKWKDGALDQYDAATKTRTVSIPAGGHLIAQVGASTQLLVDDGTVTIKAGSAQIVLQDGHVTVQADHVTVTSGDVELGASGGQAVARVGDSVDLSTGKILTGSGKVKAA